MKKVLSVFAVLALLVTGCSEDKDTPVMPQEDPAPTSNIVQIAVSNPEFSNLVKAVTFADLAGALSGDQQLTVFAPVNSAFEELAADLGYSSVDELLVEQNKELVTKVLLYHVAPGALYAQSALAAGQTITLIDQIAYIKVVEGLPYVGNDNVFAKITSTDIKATNGVIHVIDKVMLPL